MSLYIPQERLDESFLKACQFGKLDEVKRLLTSSELSQHANIGSEKNRGLLLAAIGGYIELMDYLLFSPDLTKHLSIKENNDELFSFTLQFRRVDVMKYLIFEASLEKTKLITKMLKANPNQQLEDWFNTRDMLRDLNHELSSNTKAKQKPKL